MTQDLEKRGFKRYCTDELTTKVEGAFASNIATTAFVDLTKFIVHAEYCFHEQKV